MAANSRFPPWTDEETDTLIRMYQAGHYWRDIVPAVSSASGNSRSKDGCRKKAGGLNLTVTRPRNYNRADIDDDLEDLSILGYTRTESARALGVSVRTIDKHIPSLDSRIRGGWKLRARRRKLDALAAGREEMKRRRSS